MFNPTIQTSKINKSCVSHLIIPESDQIQIVVSKASGRLGSGGTDITITSGVNKRALNSGSNVQPKAGDRSRSPSRIPLSRSASSISSSGISSTQPPVEVEKIQEYLKENPEFVQEFINKYVEDNQLDEWLAKRNVTDDFTVLSRWRIGSFPERRLPEGLTVSLGNLANNTQEGAVRWELTRFISGLVSADYCRLYLVDKRTNYLRIYDSKSKKALTKGIPISEASTMAAYVAKRGEPLRMNLSTAIQRFPNGLDEEDSDEDLLEKSAYILCLPVLRADGDAAGVIELRRREQSGSFTMDDEQVAHSYLLWGGVAFHYADNFAHLQKQKKLNDFLLTVVKSIFQDMVSMDILIRKIMKFAQKLVDADRASLFLVDNRSQELYARIFDMDTEQDVSESNEGHNSLPSDKEIRFAIGTGIAGQVASTGKPLSIADAYDDPRFNSEVDKLTGYKTKSILCMPVLLRSSVIGVVQMVNKNNGSEFTKDDEEAFETFAIYCGLALHHAKLYDKIRRSEQKSKVAVEILSYHNTANEEEVKKAKSMGLPDNVLGLDDFYLSPSPIDDDRKVLYAIYQFVDLFGVQRFDLESLYRFTLTVRKNYRRVPYHNWSHGWTVANSMYCILKASNVFRPLERLALYVGSLCHDLDHRGKSNKFMADTASPLASIYTTSTMEHHHFNQTVTILQQVPIKQTKIRIEYHLRLANLSANVPNILQWVVVRMATEIPTVDGHNIFAQLSSDEYKQVLSSIKHCILATDLAQFFPFKARLQTLISKELYSWGVPDHRLLIQAIAMTGADLCASTKNWHDQNLTVKVIFEEFYEQGDSEKAAGRTPIPMMDRDQADQQPACQVGFLSGICIPCYQILNTLIPETVPMLEGCQSNLKRWKELADEQQGKPQVENPKNEDTGDSKPKGSDSKKESKQNDSQVKDNSKITKRTFVPTYSTEPEEKNGTSDNPRLRIIPKITTTQPAD